MFDIKKWFSNLRIRNKMLVAFLPLIVVSILIIGFISYWIFQDHAVKKTIQDRMNNSYLIKQRIDNIFTNTEGCADMITFNLNNIVNEIKNENSNQLSEVERKYFIENKLNFSLVVFEDVQEAIFVDNKGEIYSSNYKQIPVESYYEIQKFVKGLEGTTGYSKWFDMTSLALSDNNERDVVLPLGKKIMEIETGDTIGYLLLFIDENKFSTLFHQMQEVKTSEFFLIDDDHRIISSTQKDKILVNVQNSVITNWIQKKTAEGDVKYLDKRKVVYTKVPLNKNKWLIVYQVNLSELMKDYQLLKNILVIVMILCAVITVIVAVKLSKVIVKPIQLLIETMQHIEQKQYNEQVYVYSLDEVGQLTYTYNRMIEKIKQLIQEVKEEQKIKRKYELSLFQEQIKPHFLYNTLDVIYVLEHMGRGEEAKLATKNLAEFYRLSLSSGKEIINIKQEIEMVEKYLYIQSFRYKDVFDYSIQMEEEILYHPILKLTIQPLVENAIYHGLKNKLKFGHLHIQGYKEDNNIYIVVKDDGVGMSKEKLQLVWGKNEPVGEHFGLINIHHRIQLFFGEQYGLDIKSEEGVGTTVTVKMPSDYIGG